MIPARQFLRYWFTKLHVAIARRPRLVLGAGGIAPAGWIATDINVLDITSSTDWYRLLGARPVEALFAEHVLEHLEVDDAERALRNAWQVLRSGGRFRIAVPDGYHPDPNYIAAVRPGGHGAGANDHRVLYNHETLVDLATRVGFRVSLLEWHDRHGQFHRVDWNSDDGMVRRSLRLDSRNRDGRPNFTSLIVDAIKP